MTLSECKVLENLFLLAQEFIEIRTINILVEKTFLLL